MSRFSTFILLLSLGLGVHQSSGVEVKVTDKNGTLCLYANLMVNFSISYTKTDKTVAVAQFQLPTNVTSKESVCGSTSSMLKLGFESGHSWSVLFKSDGKTYEAGSIVFSYNLHDSKIFPNSSSNETVSVTVKPQITSVTTDTSYSCNSSNTIPDKSVNQTLWNVLFQAFINNGSQSTNVTTCDADKPTSAPPTKPPVTTPAPTKPPVTTPAHTPTPAPTPALPVPNTGEYNVTKNDTVCLMAKFGMRLGFKQGDKYTEVNLNASAVTASGKCEKNSSELVLVSDTITVIMSFTNDAKKFRLHALNATVKTGSGTTPFTDGNTTLSLWEASVGNSYMCNKEQNHTITKNLFVFMFQLQVQPVGVKKASFSTAEECFLDSDLSFLVPIAVGVALSFLIILVLISYLIGRRKSRTGYQSV